ncbi:TatD family hydrolase [uncultured Kriegella sp.]|uniref:TatD family hydrolase n=1 Tax=uncultured Kriegella sp. TaxID=1798910 RepID=UPI0030DC0B0D|tara:strand:+ start:138645 stop:139553 length:909 start_codon:yes stop_codon:yes gene_type:complete
MDDKMMFIDPHVHMTSRTTDDYQAMAQAGVVAIIEPSFWLGQPRTQVGSFQDYYSSLVGWEPFRAKQFGIQHYCTIGLNSKEANNEVLAEQVMELLPLYFHKENVVAVGEIGYDDQTPAEDKYFRMQLEMAKELNMVVQIHTPHRDKKSGTIRSMEVCLEHGLDPSMVIVDHNNEETVKDVLDRGFWAAFTIYPETKMGNERMVAVVKQYGSKNIIVDSSADWGVSDPLAVPKTASLMLRSGVSKSDVVKTTYQNALDAFGKNGKMKESDWLQAEGINQTQLFNDNSVLRGQQPRVDDDLIK